MGWDYWRASRTQVATLEKLASPVGVRSLDRSGQSSAGGIKEDWLGLIDLSVPYSACCLWPRWADDAFLLQLTSVSARQTPAAPSPIRLVPFALANALPVQCTTHAMDRFVTLVATADPDSQPYGLQHRTVIGQLSLAVTFSVFEITV